MGEFFPCFEVGFEFLFAFSCEVVVLAVAAVGGGLPVGFDEAFGFEVVEHGVEGGLAHREYAIGLFGEGFDELVAVHGLGGEEFEDGGGACASHEFSFEFHIWAPDGWRG